MGTMLGCSRSPVTTASVRNFRRDSGSVGLRGADLLEGHGAVDGGLAGGQHDAHPPFAELAEHLVIGEGPGGRIAIAQNAGLNDQVGPVARFRPGSPDRGPRIGVRIELARPQRRSGPASSPSSWPASTVAAMRLVMRRRRASGPARPHRGAAGRGSAWPQSGDSSCVDELDSSIGGAMTMPCGSFLPQTRHFPTSRSACSRTPRQNGHSAIVNSPAIGHGTACAVRGTVEEARRGRAAGP